MNKVNHILCNCNEFDYDGKDLTIKFKGGIKKKYYDVPKYIYDDLLVINSLGKTLGSYVSKNLSKKYKTEKIK